MTAGRKALLIVDGAMLLRFAASVLAARLPGLEVITARRAGEGFLLADRQRPDLVLLDYGLPDMSGEECCRRLAAHPATASLPVIALCGKNTDPQAVRAAGPNVVRTLAKPFTPEELAAAVTAVLETGRIILAPAETPPPPGGGGEAAPSPISRHRARLTLPTAAPGLATPATDDVNREGKETADRGGHNGPRTAPDPSRVAFRGTTTSFSLHACLRAAGEEHLTGVLRVFNAPGTKTGATPTEIFFRDGSLALVTTRDTDVYAPEPGALLPAAIPPDALAGSLLAQRETACPLFLDLSGRGLLPEAEAVALVTDFGQRLFARLWTFSRLAFEFEQTDSVPGFVHRLPPAVATSSAPDGSDPDAAGIVRVANWLLGTLRRLRPEELPGLEHERFDGVPAYTREGYETIRRLQLTDLEASFARQVNGRLALRTLAERLGLAPAAAFLLLFRFRSVELMDYWPAAALAHLGGGVAD